MDLHHTPSHAPVRDAEPLLETQIMELWGNINAGTARCRWRGERMDYDIAIEALCREAGYG